MMRTNACLLLPLGVLGLALSAPAHAADTVPPDVARLAAAEAKIQAAVGSEVVTQGAYVDLFAGFLVETATTIAREQGVAEKLALDSSGFRIMAETRVAAAVRDAVEVEGKDRQDALYKLMETISTRAAAHALLAQWLGAPDPGTLAKRAKEVADAKADAAFAAARKEADQARGDRPMTDKERTERAIEDALRAAARDPEVRGARVQARFRSQVVTEQAASAFRVPSDGVALASDEGNAGDGNGVVDAGEWVVFTVPLENATREPWFSSSAWVQSASPCVWTPSSQEIELPELAPGGKGAVTVRAFVSETCADQSRARFTVTLRDTHRTQAAPVVVEVGLVVTNVGAAALRRYTMDVDVPGSSRPANAGKFAPNTRAELSAGLEIPRAGALRAVQAWGFSRPVDSIVAEQSFAVGEPMVAVAGGISSAFAPFDDLDVRIGSRAAAPLAPGRGPVDGGVLALETRVEYPAAEGSWAPPRKVELPKPTPAPVAVVPAPSADEVVGLVKKFMSVEARATTPAAGALAAASTDAYDAVLDGAAFRMAWCRATTPPAKPGEPDPCDPKACPDPTPPKPLAPVQVPVPAFEEPVAYTFRHYAWAEFDTGSARAEAPPPPRPVAAPKPEPAPAPKAAPPPPPPAAKAREPRAPTQHAVSLGLNRGSTDLSTVSWDGSDFNDAAGRTASGEQLLGLGYAFGAVDRLRLGLTTGSYEAPTLGVLTVSGGYGRAVSYARGWVELEPHADLGVAVVTANGGGETTLFADAGADLRWYPVQRVGLHAGLAWRSQLATVSGPVVATMAAPELVGSLRDATGLRLDIGVGYHF
jgi:hypothetical protein